jgi:hypothetical protein
MNGTEVWKDIAKTKGIQPLDIIPRKKEGLLTTGMSWYRKIQEILKKPLSKMIS